MRTEPTHHKQRIALYFAQAIYKSMRVRTLKNAYKWKIFAPRCALEARRRMHGTATIPYVSLKYWNGSHRKTKRKTLSSGAAVVVVIIIKYLCKMCIYCCAADTVIRSRLNNYWRQWSQNQIHSQASVMMTCLLLLCRWRRQRLLFFSRKVNSSAATYRY